MSESREYRESSRRVVENSLGKFFSDLKEHMVNLRDEDFEILSRRFTVEVDEVIKAFLKSLETRRTARKTSRSSGWKTLDVFILIFTSRSGCEC